jgi:hypothetical protein
MSWASIQEAHDGLLTAMGAVPDVRGYGELALTADPPAVYLSPPELAWKGPGPQPSEAVFSAALVVTAGERTTSELLRLLPLLVEAIETTEDAVLVSAEPGAWIAGDTSLPCYFFRIEVAL